MHTVLQVQCLPVHPLDKLFIYCNFQQPSFARLHFLRSRAGGTLTCTPWCSKKCDLYHNSHVHTFT